MDDAPQEQWEMPSLFPGTPPLTAQSVRRMQSSSTMGKVDVKVRLPIDLGRWLADEAQARGKSMSAFVTEKIAQLRDGSIWAQ